MPRDRWEYRSVRLDVGGWVGPKVDLAQLDATLNGIGADGWELVSAVDLNKSDGKTSAIVALFKRAR